MYMVQQRVTTDTNANDAWATITTDFTAAGAFDHVYHEYDNGTGIIQGSASGNTLTGGAGIDDAMIGNGGSDVFVFEVGGGVDRVDPADPLAQPLPPAVGLQPARRPAGGPAGEPGCYRDRRPARQRRYGSREVVDEGRLDELLLGEMLEERDHAVAVAHALGIDTYPFENAASLLGVPGIFR